MINLEPLRERWITERPIYEALAHHVENVVKRDLQTRGVPCSVAARAKEVPSLLRKLLRRSSTDPYESITDKAGVRVIIPFAGHAPAVDNAIRARFEIRKHE